MKKQARQTTRSTRQAVPSAGDVQDQIRRRAYELWEKDGREHGRDAEHWLQAEWEVIQQTKPTNK